MMESGVLYIVLAAVAFGLWLHNLVKITSRAADVLSQEADADVQRMGPAVFFVLVPVFAAVNVIARPARWLWCVAARVVRGAP